MSTNVARYTAVQRDITKTVRDGVMSAAPFYPLVSTVVPSTSADEKYSWLGAMPRVREWIGDRQFASLRAADFTIANKHWESSLEIPRTVVDDDRLGTLRPQLLELGQEAAMHPDELLCSLINLAESSLCFDGQYFYDTDHLWGDSGTQSNDLTYNASDHTAVTVAEFRAAFTAAVVAMMGFKRDNGTFYQRPTIGRVDNLMCAVPLKLWEVATKAFEQTIALEGTSAGTSNVLIARPKVVVNQYMGSGWTDGSDVKFDLYNLGAQLKPFVFQARQPLRVDTKGANDIEFNSYKVMTEARYNVGYLAWWAAVRTTFN